MSDHETQTQGFCFWLYLCERVVVFRLLSFLWGAGGEGVARLFCLVLWLRKIFNFWCWKCVSIRAIDQKCGYRLALWPGWARGWLRRWGRGVSRFFLLPPIRWRLDTTPLRLTKITSLLVPRFEPSTCRRFPNVITISCLDCYLFGYNK